MFFPQGVFLPVHIYKLQREHTRGHNSMMFHRALRMGVARSLGPCFSVIRLNEIYARRNLVVANPPSRFILFFHRRLRPVLNLWHSAALLLEFISGLVDNSCNAQIAR